MQAAASVDTSSKGLVALVYVSSATGQLGQAQIDGLLESSRRFNASAGVTGTLLHHDGAFLQYLEGPSDGLARVWQRVVACRMHHGITELVREPIPARFFDQWHMGFVHAPSTVLQSLAQAQWRASTGPLLARPESSDALGVLLDFWNRSRGLQCA
jgi:hypothetical protein